MKRTKKLIAFTLAEVLITIAIIGVVAALTIPSLITKIRKTIWVNQYKHAYTLVNEAFKRAMADDLTTDIGQTELMLSLNGGTTDVQQDIPEAFNTHLRKYLKITECSAKACPNKDKTCRFHVANYLNYSYTPTLATTFSARPYKLMDGITIGLNLSGKAFSYSEKYAEHQHYDRISKYYAENNLYDSSYGTVLIDVNGDKGPSTFGRDIFVFMLAPNGTLYPAGSLQYSVWFETYHYGNPHYDRHTWKKEFNTGFTCSTTKPSYGYACSARVIDEGWKMNY